jgi:hypothetical protein
MFRPEEILERLRKSPFTPVRIKVSSGEALDVFHPDLVLVGQRDITLGTANKRNPATYDSQTRVAIMHITMLEDIASPASHSSSNGEE